MDKNVLRREQILFQTLLKEMRQEAGLRQLDLADRIEEPQSFVSKYESGERRLDVLELRRICKAVGVSLSEFLQRLENRLREVEGDVT